MRTLTQLKADLKALQNEHDEISTRCSQEDIECVSDRYQEALEATWYKRDLRDQMHELEEQIVALELESINTRIAQINKMPGYITAKEAHEITTNRAMTLYYSLPDAQAKRTAQKISQTLERLNNRHVASIITNGVSEHDCATDHCPSCGSYEGDSWSCPECGRNE